MKPNILLIILDSLRADKLFGEKKTAKTPTIDSMIKNGSYFSNSFTTNQYTSQVMQTIFSGRFLINDKTTQNYSSEKSFLSNLKNSGYHNFTINKEDVFFQGLKEKFDDSDVSFKDGENIYNGLEERILQKLASLPEPWFYYIHLQDLHTPCLVPDEFSHLTLEKRYDHNLEQIDLFIKKILEMLQLEKTIVVLSSDHGEYISPLESGLKEIPSIGSSLKNKFKTLIPEKTLEKIHNEKKIINSKIQSQKTNRPHEKRTILYNRRMLSKTLYDDIIHIPLLFYGYKINPNDPLNEQVCNVDILPTILELIDVPFSSQNIHGKSLVPLLNNEKYESSPIYLTSNPILKQLKANIKLESSDPVIGIRTSDYKYFRNYENPNKNINLYDLKNDPFEEKNIADTEVDVVKKMESYIENFESTSEDIESDMEDIVDDDEIRKARESLKKLGYI